MRTWWSQPSCWHYSGMWGEILLQNYSLFSERENPQDGFEPAVSFMTFSLPQQLRCFYKGSWANKLEQDDKCPVEEGEGWHNHAIMKIALGLFQKKPQALWQTCVVGNGFSCYSHSDFNHGLKYITQLALKLPLWDFLMKLCLAYSSSVIISVVWSVLSDLCHFFFPHRKNSKGRKLLYKCVIYTH